MALHLEEIEDTETQEITYELQDENGNTVVNLTDTMDGSLWYLEKCDDYYEGFTSGVDDIERQVIFDLNGSVIISRIISHKYIEKRNEFIVYLNGANNDDCYNQTFKYDEEYCGLINSHGDFILSPKYDKIEYLEEFDLYLVDDEDYYINSEYIGKLADQEIDDYLVLSKNNKLGLRNKEGIILDAVYTEMWQSSDDGYIVISDGTKFGIYSIESSKQPELKFEEVSESFYYEIMGEGYYLVRIGSKFGLANKQMELLFDNLLDGIDEDSFSDHSYVDHDGKTINYTTFIACEKGKYWHGQISDDVSTTRKCVLSGSGQFPAGFDYLKTIYLGNKFSEIENIYINVGFGIWKGHRNYQLLVSIMNKLFYQEDYTNYPLGLNDELLVTCLEEDRYGALVINKTCQINESSNRFAIPFIYKKLQVIKSEKFLITGLIGEINNIYDIYEPMQFRQIGQTNSHDEALEILKGYYTSSK